MPQTTSLTILAADVDDLTVDEVYEVVSRNGNRTIFRNVGTGPIELAKRIVVTLTPVTSQSTTYKVLIELMKPESFTDADTGLTSMKFTNVMTCEFKVNKQSTIDEAKSMSQRGLAVLSLASIQQVVNEAESFW